MREGLESVYDKWNISVVICDTYSITVNQVVVCDRNIFEVMTSTLPKGILGSVASLLPATLLSRKSYRNHQLWNIVLSERYILHSAGVAEMLHKERYSGNWYSWKIAHLTLINDHSLWKFKNLYVWSKANVEIARFQVCLCSVSLESIHIVAIVQWVK